MSELSWFEAFARVNDFVQMQGEAEDVEAWERFLKSPFPHLLGELGSSSEKFAATAAAWDGRGMELLVYRLVQAVEQLPVLIAPVGEALRKRKVNGKGSDEWRVRPVVVMGQPVAAGLGEGFAEGFYQPDYCEECGAELDTGGNCLVCAAA